MREPTGGLFPPANPLDNGPFIEGTIRKRSALATKDPPPWPTGYFRLFITHIARNKAAAESIRQALLPHWVAAFVAHSQIRPTKEWLNEILVALNTADALVALMYRGYHSSNWTDQETGIAIGRGLLVVPVSFGETPYGFVGRYQAVQGRGKSWDELAQDLYQILLTHDQTKRAMASALVSRLSDSPSFDDAKHNMTLLSRVNYWDSRLTQRAHAAVQTNDQVSEAWGVPQSIERLISKWTN